MKVSPEVQKICDVMKGLPRECKYIALGDTVHAIIPSHLAKDAARLTATFANQGYPVEAEMYDGKYTRLTDVGSTVMKAALRPRDIIVKVTTRTASANQENTDMKSKSFSLYKRDAAADVQSFEFTPNPNIFAPGGLKRTGIDNKPLSVPVADDATATPQYPSTPGFVRTTHMPGTIAPSLNFLPVEEEEEIPVSPANFSAPKPGVMRMGDSYQFTPVQKRMDTSFSDIVFPEGK